MGRSLNTKNIISTSNVRAGSQLAAGGIYQGTGEDVTKYGRAGISITSDNFAEGVLTIEVSRDGVTYSGPTRTYSDTRFSQPHMWNIVEQYFRIKYTNGTTTAENLVIQVQYSVNADIILGHQLDETLIDETEATVTRAVLVGKTEAGKYVNVPVSGIGEILTKTKDDDSRELLVELIKETKLTNFYLEQIWGEKLTIDEELEDDIL